MLGNLNLDKLFKNIYFYVTTSKTGFRYKQAFASGTRLMNYPNCELFNKLAS